MVISTSWCEFNKEAKTLMVSSEFFAGSFPSEVLVESSHTGRQVLFRVIRPGDPIYDEDQYDGEMQMYRPTKPVAKVDFLIVRHEW